MFTKPYCFFGVCTFSVLTPKSDSLVITINIAASVTVWGRATKNLYHNVRKKWHEEAHDTRLLLMLHCHCISHSAVQRNLLAHQPIT